jgi:cytochrome c oxidase assembly protein subunit 11
MPSERPRHLVLSLVCGGVAIGMVGMAYAAVPFYRAFCQATGFDGTVRRGDGPIGAPIDRKLTVRFDTNVRNLPWTFKPEVPSQEIQIGAPSQAWFKIKNNSDVPITGRALYNVTPESAAAYFIKTECFCFKDQTIPAHTEMRFPVIYYVQPGFAKDRDTKLFQEITLSYTYFPSTNVAQPAVAAPAAAPLAKTAAAKAPEALGGTPSRGL